MGEAKEGEERGVSTELDANLGRGLANNGGVQLLHNLGGKSGASNGTDGFTGVVRKSELVLIGASVELVKVIGSEETG